MRAPLVIALAAVALSGCVSGTRTIVVREYPAATPAPTPAPQPVPVPLPTPRRLMQLEVAVGSPAAGKVPVETNRAAYVALFEIVPQQGVTLLHPTTQKQGRSVLTGMSWIPVMAGTPATTRRVSNPGRGQEAVRYIYALASDTPLRIPDRAIEPGYLEQLLGPAAFRAASPQAAVRALSRQFAPKVSDEQWAEDLYVVESSDDPRPPRMARVYCWNGRVHQVPEEMADRAWCPERPGNSGGGGVMPTPTRPDSVVGNNGRRIGPRSPRTPGRTAGEPERGRGQPATPAKPAHPVKPEHPSTPRNDQAEKDRAEKEKRDKEEKDRVEKAEKEKRDKEEKDRVEKAEKEKRDKEEKGRVEKEKKDKADKARADSARAENERAEKARADKEKADKDKLEKEKAEKEKADKEKLEKEKAEKDRMEKEKAEKEKADKEKAENDRAQKEKKDKENAGKSGPDDESESPGRSEKPDRDDEAAGAGKDDDKQKADKPAAGKPDESEKDKENKENKEPKKPKPAAKPDSTKSNAPRGTPNRGRNS